MQQETDNEAARLEATLATTRLREICKSKDEPNMIEVASLIAANANVNDVDSTGYNLLHELVRSGHQELARYLIGKGANLEHRANDGLKNTPVLYATWSHPNVEMAKLFISCGASLSAKDSVGDTALHNAGLKGLTEVASHTMNAREDVEPALRNNSKRSALGNGAFNGHKDFVSSLLENGWPVDAQALGFGGDAAYYFNNDSGSKQQETFRLIRSSYTAAYDLWLDFWDKRKGDVSTLTRADVCRFANADLHAELFEPELWEDHKEHLHAILTGIPPWLVRDIIEKSPRIGLLITPPESLIEPWDSELYGRIVDGLRVQNR